VNDVPSTTTVCCSLRSKLAISMAQRGPVATASSGGRLSRASGDAFALEMQALVADGARHVDRQHQREISLSESHLRRKAKSGKSQPTVRSTHAAHGLRRAGRWSTMRPTVKIAYRAAAFPVRP
jgi:hypothetical protein